MSGGDGDGDDGDCRGDDVYVRPGPFRQRQASSAMAMVYEVRWVYAPSSPLGTCHRVGTIHIYSQGVSAGDR